ncbi:unnamed protein product [Gemmata massiliana]|uniref:Uncharacterized protein n=1 Tax=Gemmata massiliana TaxID=1210884 RepID=A0A6P2DE84_9BACT|nr:hypothetical protein [Gemmata massiliana]VTR98829.1 unnamed protein product [Gemmata massiliana]
MPELAQLLDAAVDLLLLVYAELRDLAYRQWTFARAWLRCVVGGDGVPTGGTMSTESAAKTVFLAALEKARAAYLNEACAGWSKRCSAHDRPNPLLDRPAAAHLAVDGDGLRSTSWSPGR